MYCVAVYGLPNPHSSEFPAAGADALGVVSEVLDDATIILARLFSVIYLSTVFSTPNTVVYV